MKRDMDRIREMVLELQGSEAWPRSGEFVTMMTSKDSSLSPALARYHIDLLRSGGLVEPETTTEIGVKSKFKRHVKDTRLILSWAGQDFADNVANDGLWAKVKSALNDAGLKSAAFSVWARLASEKIGEALDKI
jgi:hypothetical protein